MYASNPWGGPMEIVNGDTTEDERSRNLTQEWDRASVMHQYQQQHGVLDETQQSWLLGPPEDKKKNKYVDLGCVVVSRKLIKWTMVILAIAFLVIALPIIIAKTIPKHKHHAAPPDEYSLALHKALMFFNAQKSGRLPSNNGVPWRGNSGLQDGSTLTDIKGGLVGGYYDSGENTKYHFPMSFAMTMLSWSVIEYEAKYKAMGEYNHVRDIIKWGTDYLLLTFNNTAGSKLNKIYSQVGGGLPNSTIPDDNYCWMRPEDMDYERRVQTTTAGPDLAGEMAAALAAASIVFRDNNAYSSKLIKGATTVFAFARSFGKRNRYSLGNSYISSRYNSTGYYDEYMWGSAWMYYATGNASYISLATNPGLPKNSKAFSMAPKLSVLSWDNKLPAAMLLLTRLRLFLSPGYPYEAMLQQYQNVTGLTMCSYLERFHVFNWTKGGLVEMKFIPNITQPDLQYAVNAAFLASLYADYLNASSVPGWFCGPTFIPTAVLRQFATSQIDYILGANPLNMSYVVGYGSKYPKRVHHRAASIPHDKNKYSCTAGWKYRDSANPNPHTITGAMVGGPDSSDKFKDLRNNYTYTEPTLAGNAGLVAALVSLTSSGGYGIDKNTIFSAVPPLYPIAPPPPPPWKP